MGSDLGRDRPAIGVRVDPACAGTSRLVEMLAGLEEEGVPGRLEFRQGAADGGQPGAVALAHEAARASPLEVGLGMDATGAVALHYRREHRDRPIMVVASADETAARVLGMNAARLVKVQPLKFVGENPGR